MAPADAAAMIGELVAAHKHELFIACETGDSAAQAVLLFLMANSEDEEVDPQKLWKEATKEPWTNQLAFAAQKWH